MKARSPRAPAARVTVRARGRGAAPYMGVAGGSAAPRCSARRRAARFIPRTRALRTAGSFHDSRVARARTAFALALGTFALPLPRVTFAPFADLADLTFFGARVARASFFAGMQYV